MPTFTYLLLSVFRVAHDPSIKSTLVEREPVPVRFQPHCTVELGRVNFCYSVRDKADAYDVIALYAIWDELRQVRVGKTLTV